MPDKSNTVMSFKFNQLQHRPAVDLIFYSPKVANLGILEDRSDNCIITPTLHNNVVSIEFLSICFQLTPLMGVNCKREATH